MPVRLGPKDLSHSHSGTLLHIGANQHSVARAQRLRLPFRWMLGVRCSAFDVLLGSLPLLTL